MLVLSHKLCLTLCDRMHYSLPGFSVCETSQARILEGVAISFPGNLADPETELGRQRVDSCLAGRFFTTGPLRKPIYTMVKCNFKELNSLRFFGFEMCPLEFPQVGKAKECLWNRQKSYETLGNGVGWRKWGKWGLEAKDISCWRIKCRARVTSHLSIPLVPNSNSNSSYCTVIPAVFSTILHDLQL